MKLPQISIIIPIAPNGNCDIALNSIKNQDYDKKMVEVFITMGKHRSIQRNKALEKTTGEIIFFLDDDVIIKDKDYFKKHIVYYENKRIASVGGPSLTPETDSFLQKCFGYVLGSYFATQSMRAKFSQIGKVRKSNEKELILCNQSFKASLIKQEKGFDYRLHSGNEENELMNRLSKKKYLLIYDPEIKTYKSQRETIIDFIKQMAKYGKGRIEHLIIKPSSFNILFMIPTFFLMYLILIPLIRNMIYMIPLFIYIILVLISSFNIVLKSKDLKTIFIVPPLFPIVHVSYALGIFYGLFKYLVPEKRKIPTVIVKKIEV